MFHLRCITLCFAFSLMPPCHLFQVTSGSLHVTFCSRLFPVCFHTEANTGSQSVACLLPQTRILFICMHVSFTCVACLVLHCLCMAFFGGFQVFFVCLIIRNNKGIALFPSIPVFLLSYPKLHFWRFFTLLAHESNVKPALCSIHWRWRLCIFLPFSHNINSLYPIWIIGRLTAIWKSRWCFPDLPPPSLSWLKGS